MRIRLVLFFFIALALKAVGQNEVQQLYPCLNDSSEVIPGCVAISLGYGQYCEAVRDTSYCSGDTLFTKYVAANSFLAISQGDSVYMDTLYNGCSGGGSLQSEMQALFWEKLTDQTATTSYVDVTSWDNVIISSSNFTTNNTTGEVTFDSAGLYLIEVNAFGNHDGTLNSRTNLYLEAKVDTSGAYVSINEVYNTYYRGNNFGTDEGNISGSFLFNFDAGDKLKLQLKYEGEQDGDLLDCRLSIVALEGAQGIQGPPGDSDGNDIDSTRLEQDSILVYYFNNSESGRDTIRLEGGGEDGNGIFTADNSNRGDTIPADFSAYATDSITFLFDYSGGDTSEITLGNNFFNFKTRQTNPDEFYLRVYTFLNILRHEVSFDLTKVLFDSDNGNYYFESFDLTTPVTLRLRPVKADAIMEYSYRTASNDDHTVKMQIDYSDEDFEMIDDNGNEVITFETKGSGDIFFPQYDTDKVITSQTNKYVSMIDTTNGQMFLIHPDSIGGAGGGGSADGNDFLTDHSVTGASGTNSRTLTSTVSNQPDVTATINVADADSSTTNEIQTLSIDSTASNGTFRTFTISLTDGGSVSFNDSIGAGGGGGSDGFIIPDSLINKTNGSTERITFHYTDEVGNQDSIFTTFTDDTGAGGTDDQTLSLDSTATNYSLSIESGNTVSWTKSSDSQTLSHSAGTGGNDEITISNGNTITITDDVDDADADATNEFQTMSIDSVGRKFTLTLTDGNSVSWIDSVGEAGTTDGNDFVTSISESEPTDSTVRLELNIPNQLDPSTTFNINDNDADASNEIQSISIDSTGRVFTITLTDGGSVTFEDTDTTTPDTDDQTLSFTSPNLSISDGNTVDLSALQDGTGTDDQNIQGGSWNSGTNELTVDIEDGSGQTFDLSSLDDDTDADADPNNEIQTLSWSAGTGGDDEITLSDGGGTITIIDDVNDADSNSSNELQTLQAISETNGATIDLSNTPDDIKLVENDGILISRALPQEIYFDIHQDSIDSWSGNGMFDSDNEGLTWEVENFNTSSNATTATMGNDWTWDMSGNQFNYELQDHSINSIVWQYDVGSNVVAYEKIGDGNDFTQRFASSFDLGIKSEDSNIPGTTEYSLIVMGNSNDPYLEIGNEDATTWIQRQHYEIQSDNSVTIDLDNDIYHYTGSGASRSLPPISQWYNESSYSDRSIVLVVKHAGSSGTLTLTAPSGANIDGGSSISLSSMESVEIYTDGTDLFTK